MLFLFNPQAFGAFDKDKRGRLSPGDFRRVLDHFCFKMTDKQFKSLMTKLRVNSDLTISYPAFLDEFSANEQEVNNQHVILFFLLQVSFDQDWRFY